MPARQSSVQQQPDVPPVPAQLAGGVEGAASAYLQQGRRRGRGEGGGVQPQVALRHSEEDERGGIG